MKYCVRRKNRPCGVYIDTKARELETLLVGEKTMIIRGATGRKLPYGRVQPIATDVFNSQKLTEEESVGLLETNQGKLKLTPEQVRRWAGKRYLVLIEVQDVQSVEPFEIDRSGYGNMDDWLPVEFIEHVMN